MLNGRFYCKFARCSRIQPLPCQMYLSQNGKRRVKIAKPKIISLFTHHELYPILLHQELDKYITLLNMDQVGKLFWPVEDWCCVEVMTEWCKPERVNSSPAPVSILPHKVISSLIKVTYWSWIWAPRWYQSLCMVSYWLGEWPSSCRGDLHGKPEWHLVTLTNRLTRHQDKKIW